MSLKFALERTAGYVTVTVICVYRLLMILLYAAIWLIK